LSKTGEQPLKISYLSDFFAVFTFKRVLVKRNQRGPTNTMYMIVERVETVRKRLVESNVAKKKQSPSAPVLLLSK